MDEKDTKPAFLDLVRWAQRDCWDTHEAALLFSGVIPDNFDEPGEHLIYEDEHDKSSESTKEVNCGTDSSKAGPWLRLIALARERRDLPEASKKLSPKTWLSWARAFGNDTSALRLLEKAVDAAVSASVRESGLRTEDSALTRAKRRPGPKPGTIARYAESDRALFPELERIKAEEKLSVHAAALLLVRSGKAGGSGTEDSVARRLASHFRKEYRR